MTLDKVFALAVKHLGQGNMESSARLCLADARQLEANGDLRSAERRALASLRYSVGIFHPDYLRADPR
jgi:hypothetical protein